ncbi:MAG: hypothetical protein HYR64_10905 [Fimbriimonas ginsengisoli]|uniref:Uncharacterized protein n=1 Tax=Fimbriimonas ginsengisoli TaxID=1005039 RepID=A0A931LZG5_FIMGI|nr:hypothetical protein [Fimbriimonas ginsengisoli]
MIDPLKIHALADAELSKEDAEALAHEIAKCRRSTLELETIQGLKLIVNKHCQPVACDDTWCKCRKRLDEIDRAQRVEGFVGRYAWGLCGTFLLAIVVGGLATRNGSAGMVRSGEVPRMVSGLAPLALIRPHTIDEARKFVAEKLGRSPVSLPDQRISILEGAYGSSDGRRLVRLHLRDSGGDALLVVVPGAVGVEGTQPLGSGEYCCGRINGTNCLVWNSNGCMLMLLGDRSTEDLHTLAGEVAFR